MSAPSLSDYASALESSRLLEKPKLQRAYDAFLQSTEPALRTAKAFADALASQGLVTPWQNEQLLRGRHKGFVVGKYKLLQQLGRGGMASVYLAEHQRLQRKVALKVLPKSIASAPTSHLARFQREARALAKLNHRNIVRVYDIDAQNDNHFIAMEFIQGVDLQQLVDAHGPLGDDEAVDYIRQAAAGLQHAHQRQLIHRDVKPANLLRDESNTIKLLDLGLSQITDDKAALTTLFNEHTLGTVDFISPEQAINSHRVDARADIYSLGGTLYFLLTGHAPFHEGSIAERLLAHQSKEPPNINAERHKLKRSAADDDLVHICQRMMAKSPDDRFTAAELQVVLDQWREGRANSTAVRSASPRGKPPVVAVAPTAAKTACPLAHAETRIEPAVGEAKPRPSPAPRNRRSAPTKSRYSPMIIAGVAALLLLGGAAAAIALAFVAFQRPKPSPSNSAVAGIETAAPIGSEQPGAIPSPATADGSVPVADRSNENIAANPHGQQRFYVVGSSNKYHRTGCRFVTTEAREVTAAEARASYLPCKVCKPDQ